MKILLVLILLAALVVGTYWYLGNGPSKEELHQTQTNAFQKARELGDSVKEKFKDLNTSDIKDELERTGKVVRKKAEQVGSAIADATSDTRITATIKAKLVKDPDLSALRISVSTTDGVVTLAGSVDSADQVAQAMKLALDTDGVREAISTLQVAKNPKSESSRTPK